MNALEMGRRLSWGVLSGVLLLVYGLLVMFFAMVEPVLRVILLGAAFVTFWMAVIFGFLMDAPHFPAWGMLVFSVSAFGAYLVVLLVQHFLIGLPNGR